MTEEIKKEETRQDPVIPAATVTQPETPADYPAPPPDPVGATPGTVPAPADPEIPPEVVGEQTPPPDPSIIGELEKNEIAVLQALQNKQRAMTFQLGELEIRKAMLLGQIQALDNQAAGVYKGVASRLQIGDTVHWTVTADFKVRILPTPQPPKP